MDKKNLSKTVHSESCERDPLFEAAARHFVADGHSTIAMFAFSLPISLSIIICIWLMQR